MGGHDLFLLAKAIKYAGMSYSTTQAKEKLEKVWSERASLKVSSIYVRIL